MRPTLAFLALILGIHPLVAESATYYVAPAGAPQSCAPVGSQSCPFATLNTAFDSGKIVSGDTILMMDGTHAGVTLNMRSFSNDVTITPQNLGKARIEYISVGNGSKHLAFRNLNVWPTNPHGPAGALLATASGSSYITFANIDARGGQDATNYMSWSLTEWQARTYDGAIIQGTSNTVKDSMFTGVHLGIAMFGNNGVAQNNIIDGYSNDGMRADGNYVQVIGNRITNCIAIDGNHTDGIQSVAESASGVTGLDIERNTILEWAQPVANPLRCQMQGIGFFDGPYLSLKIINNVVAVGQWHGLSVNGGNGVLVANNTVLADNGRTGITPWIGLFPGKDGTPSQNVVYANNLAADYNGGPSTTYNVKFIKNMVIKNPTAMFVNPAAHDYRPKPGTAPIDSAGPKYAPPIDIIGTTRPLGLGPDRGAYEVQ